MKKSQLYIIILLTGIILLPDVMYGQLQRERVQTNNTVDNVFWAPTNIGLSTVGNISSNNLNTSVMHTFGLTSRGIEHLWGLDDGANTRIGLDYGFSDKFSAGIGRMTFNKVVDLRTKYNILRQTKDNGTPVELAAKASVGITTLSGLGLEFSDRLSYFASLMVARKFERLSLQVSPMAAFFNTRPAGAREQLYGIGLVAAYELNERFSLSAEYLPVIGERNPLTSNAMGIALNIDTGGHVFQVFLTSSQWHNEQYIMANNRDRFWEGDFRFGFNINRVFGL
ncbi:MAG: DUF5777 family beta-barrel protein [Balneolaceae bacterium]